VLSDRRDLLAWRILSYPLRNVRGVQPARIWRGDITNVSFDDLVRLVQAVKSAAGVAIGFSRTRT
jgi:hypothetical protein